MKFFDEKAQEIVDKEKAIIQELADSKKSIQENNQKVREILREHLFDKHTKSAR